MATKNWSDKQANVFSHFIEQPLVNLVVRARAGTGKTTTIVEAVKRLLQANPSRKIIIAAFGKAIADELVARFVGYDVTVKTLHALGLSCVKRFWPKVKVSFDEHAR
jgi:superfamily I DNA/RNA helicase